MAYNFISDPKKLQTLKERIEAQIAPMTPQKGFTDEELTWNYWVNIVDQCIKYGMAMDEVDYANSPKEVKVLWKGLKDKDPLMKDVY